MHTARKAWIVLADGEHARIVVSTQVAGAFSTQESLDSRSAHLLSRDIGSDRPGRSFESASASRHAMEPRTDPHELEKVRFLQLVADELSRQGAAGNFDRLVLVAPARALHDLRHALDRATAERVADTLAKDLTGVPDSALGPHLATWWEPSPAT
jgi:protein required for attachment to host cells